MTFGSGEYHARLELLDAGDHLRRIKSNRINKRSNRIESEKNEGRKTYRGHKQNRDFIAKQPAPVPHLRVVLRTVPRVSRSHKQFLDGFFLHLIQPNQDKIRSNQTSANQSRPNGKETKPVAYTAQSCFATRGQERDYYKTWFIHKSSA